MSIWVFVVSYYRTNLMSIVKDRGWGRFEVSMGERCDVKTYMKPIIEVL